MIAKMARLVTVGVPSYNRPDGLRRCLSSLMDQTFKDFAIVVSDNASSDPSVWDVLGEFARMGDRMSVICQPVNLGPTANFLAVVARAESPYFMWCADDDWLEPDAIEKLVQTIDDARVSLAYPTTVTHHRDGSTAVQRSRSVVGSPFVRILRYYMSVGANGQFYGLGRTELFRQIGLLNRLAEDWMFVAQLACSGELRLVPEAVLHRTAGGTSRSVREMCMRLELPRYVALVPNLVIAAGAARDIATGRALLGEIGVLKRTCLAAVCFAALYTRLTFKRGIAAPVIGVLTKTLGEARYKKFRLALRGRIGI